MKKVSIIIPVYNVSKYIDSCLRSIIKQDYLNLEIILINDGSTDDSLIKCNFWKSQDERIIVLSNNNKGVSYTRNYGLKFSTGDYIAFIDPDDFISFNFISSMVKLLEENNTDLACCSIKKFLYENEINFEKGNENFYVVTDIKKNLFQTAGGFLANKLYKSSIIKKNNLLLDEKIHISEDLLFNMQYASFCNSMIISENCKYFYRQHNESAYQKHSEKWFTVLDTYGILLGDKKLVSNELKYTVIFNYLMILCEAKCRIKNMKIKDSCINIKINKELKKYFKLENIKKLSIIKKIKIFIFMTFPNFVWMYKQKIVKG